MTDAVNELEVEGGLWWSGATWTLRSVPQEGGPLPRAGAPWRRVPGWLLLPLAPVVGGAFVVALPLAGAFLVAQAVARRVLAGGSRAARDLATAVATPAPQPGQAHLAGQPGPEAAAPVALGAEPPATAPGAATPLDAVEAEVRARQASAAKAE